MHDIFICDYIRRPIGRFGGAPTTLGDPAEGADEEKRQRQLGSTRRRIYGCAN
jgi:hypothetical protein